MIEIINIKTERCAITELIPNDFQEAVSLFTNEKVRRYLGGTITKDVALEKLNMCMGKNENYYFCVRTSETGIFVGVVTITEYHDKHLKELSYQFLPEFWGLGMATESICAILEFLKNISTINELIAETQGRNIGSCQLLEKLGFVFENTITRFGEKQNIYKLILR